MTLPLSAKRLRVMRAMVSLVFAALTASPLAAQGVQPHEPVNITGMVVEGDSGLPIPGAAILLSDRAGAVISDRRGRFTLPDVEPGAHSVVVTQLGYDTLWTQLEIAPDPGTLTLRLAADPIVLERVTAMVDRLASRRNAVGTSVRVFDRIDLQTSTARTVLEHIGTRTALRMTRCSDFTSLSPCARVRGRSTEVQVYLDGARVIGGLDVLAAYPPEEMYTVEVIGGGRSVRAYTNWFMETVASGRRLPDIYLF